MVKDYKDFFSIVHGYLNNIKNRNQFHQYDIDFKRIEVFKQFVNKEVLKINELNIELIIAFEAYLFEKRNIVA